MPQSTSERPNRALLRHFFEHFSDPKIAVEDLSRDYMHHDPTLPADLQSKNGREAYKEILHAFNSAFPDLRVELLDIFSELDKAAARWKMTGTNNGGSFLSFPPTNRHIDVVGISLHRFADGKIAESWVCYDSLGLMRQLGVMPLSPSGPNIPHGVGRMPPDSSPPMPPAPSEPPTGR